MPPLEARLRLLRTIDPKAADAFLAAAMGLAAEEEEVEPICLAAIGLGRPAGLLAAIARVHVGGPAVADALALSRANLDDPLRRALGSADSRVRRNAIAVIVRRGDGRLAGHLPPMLIRSGARDDGEGDRCAEAAAALVELTVATVGESGRRRDDAEALVALDLALAEAAAGFRAHRRRDVLVAAAIASGGGFPALEAVLAEPDHPAALGLRGIPLRVSERLVRANLLRWLGRERLGSSAARGLHRLRGAAAFSEALASGHLLRAPRRRRALRSVDRPTACVPPPADAVEMPPGAQAALADLLTWLDLSPRTRIARLAETIALPSAPARWRALGSLLALSPARASAALETFAFDRERAVAHAAAVHLLGAAPDDRSERRDLALGLLRSPHRPVARRARTALARAHADDLDAAWSDLAGAARLAAARRLLRDDRGGLVALLARRLGSGRRAERVEAVLLGGRLRLVPLLEDELVAAAEEGDPHVASAALGALAAGRGGRRLETCRAALERDDPRVRANAVESLARSAFAAHRAVIEIVARSSDHRPRANAVRALVRSGAPEGLAELDRMLGDPDPMHRVSGIWVARGAGGPLRSAALARLAEEDRSQEVRVRAQAALRWLGAPGPRPAPAAALAPALAAAPLLDPASTGAIVLVAAGAALAAAAIVAWVQADRARHGPAVRRLARGLGLGRRQCRLLRRVGRLAGMPEAGALLISRGCFDAAAAAYAKRFGPQPALARIRRTLFGP